MYKRAFTKITRRKLAKTQFQLMRRDLIETISGFEVTTSYGSNDGMGGGGFELEGREKVLEARRR